MSHLILPIEDVAAKVAAAGFTGWQVVTGVAVITAESRFDAYAVNVVGEEFRSDGTRNPAYRSLDVGLFQANMFWNPGHDIATLLDPDANCQLAHQIFTSQFAATPGAYAERLRAAWSLWVTYRKGLHKPFEADAVAAARAIGVAV